MHAITSLAIITDVHGASVQPQYDALININENNNELRQPLEIHFDVGRERVNLPTI